MREIFFIIALAIGLVQTGYSQVPGGAANKHYTVGELDKMGKLELSRLYVAQVNKLNLLLPYIPFNQKGDAVSLAGMGIPNTKNNNGAIKEMDGTVGNHNSVMGESLTSLIPYADKVDIIKSILFLQNVVERVEAGI